MGADTLEIDAEAAPALCRVALEAYAEALQRGKAFWIERDVADGVVRELLDQLRHREGRASFDKRSAGTAPRAGSRSNGGRALKASEPTSRCAPFMAGFAATRPDPEFFRVLDVERRVAGTGSLGLARWVVLVHGEGGDTAQRLLDLKVRCPRRSTAGSGVS